MPIEKLNTYTPQREFTYNPEDLHLWENLPRARLLRVSQRGYDASVVAEPPRRRSMVIALGINDQIVVTFPFGNTELEGFHDHSESWAIDRLGRLKTWAILHGSISLAENEKGERVRTAYIYEAAEEDKVVIRESGSYMEQGKVDPLKFLAGPNFIPERLMQSLAAKELRIVEGIASTSLYNLVKSSRK